MTEAHSRHETYCRVMLTHAVRYRLTMALYDRVSYITGEWLMFPLADRTEH